MFVTALVYGVYRSASAGEDIKETDASLHHLERGKGGAWGWKKESFLCINTMSSFAP